MFNLKTYLQFEIAERMSEDNVPDDLQPDKEFEYLERFMERVTNDELQDWLKDLNFHAFVVKNFKWSFTEPFSEDFIIKCAFEYYGT